MVEQAQKMAFEVECGICAEKFCKGHTCEELESISIQSRLRNLGFRKSPRFTKTGNAIVGFAVMLMAGGGQIWLDLVLYR